MNHAQQHRMDAASDRDAFDWDAWNAEIEAGLAALETLDSVEAAIAQARIAKARDVRVLLTKEQSQ